MTNIRYALICQNERATIHRDDVRYEYLVNFHNKKENPRSFAFETLEEAMELASH